MYCLWFAPRVPTTLNDLTCLSVSSLLLFHWSDLDPQTDAFVFMCQLSLSIRPWPISVVWRLRLFYSLQTTVIGV